MWINKCVCDYIRQNRPVNSYLIPCRLVVLDSLAYFASNSMSFYFYSFKQGLFRTPAFAVYLLF